MRDEMRRWLRVGSEGQGLVEMVLVLPVLLIMFLGLVELGFLMRVHLVIVNANREAARFAGRGTFTDAQIAERATTSFAGQLPVNMSGPDANTEIVITRFNVPSANNAAATYKPSWITGTLELDSLLDPAAYASQLAAENDQFNDDLIASQPDAIRTAQDVVVVEIFYYHYEVLRAPIVEWVFPDPMVVYSRTVMRVGASRVY